MEKKVVLITGGSSGIGKSIGTFLTTKGYKVYGTTRTPANYPDFDVFDLIQLDVRDVDSIQDAVSHVIAKEGRLDVLINNAGVGITGPIEETPHEEILKVFDTNFHGPVHMMKAVLPQMRNQGGGTIVNITSIAGYMGLPFRGFYSATKGALGLITEALRMETKDFGVTITNVAPGDFATNIAAGRYHAPVLDGSPYEDKYARTIDSINGDVDSGGDPEQVARAIYSIINKKRPKVHNPVGAFLQKFSLTLKRVLPDKVYEKLLLNHYKL
ncbi:Short-chain dehydrogenase [Flagellimonas taeanensis]|jgi:NAD(P)-dependent dehydrogenase (short-subunit alcohol dehydrogenase family)|uniref:Short-chain dehydrogenase n=1 Tax=Flagellimonas taeanensis TaxID=1005926 RepID=A0A1M7C0T6_9FLAO|nr:SDR family oxidoreductase [Allomuricauda taeanensis]SFC51266.1 Short-chain dehydrogenase [Allomuricauda taeanensis]SHL60743.1 Short-chain dehydrogenase [Allomuricauda taeanensis]